MRDEQLYIDGVLVDIDDNTELTMDYNSQVLGDISKWACNKTWSVKLPKTVKNRKVLGFSDMVQAGVKAPYVFHVVRYFRNGVELIRNGRLSILSASDDGFDVCIIWGMFPAFELIKSNNVTLNMLESDERILFQQTNAPVNFSETAESDVFYAEMDCKLYEDSVEDDTWKSSGGAISGTEGAAEHSGVQRNFNGRRGTGRTIGTAAMGGRYGSANRIPVHPCVKVSWLLGLIREQIGVDFCWTGEAKDYIDSLIVPVINNKANEMSYDGAFAATLSPSSVLGYLSVTVSNSITAIQTTQGNVHTLTVAADSKLIFDVTGTYRRDVTRNYNNHGIYHLNGVYIELAVTRGGEKAAYIVGSNSRHPISESRKVAGYITFEIGGRGAISVVQGDQITFELKYDGEEVLDGLYFAGGTITAAVGESDEVPIGGYFPIAENLPEIKIIDFVKFLSAVTGTFPKQALDGNKLTFVSFQDVWDNMSRAVDWTRRLIAPNGENSPQEMTYKGEFCQHNLYKWKDDETVKGDYDGDLQIANDILEERKTIYEFPFAATDGNNVPLYKIENENSTSGSSSHMGGTRAGESEESTDDLTEPERPTYSKCEPRILNLVENDGKAKAWFDMDMQEIIDRRYACISRSLNAMKIITESIRIRDMELRNFDETVPVYLAQYGCYFAVLNMKVQADGLAEVKMIQLITE